MAKSQSDCVAAIKRCSDGIAADRYASNLYLERAMRYLDMKQYPAALDDAMLSTKLKPEWRALELSPGDPKSLAALKGIENTLRSQQDTKYGSQESSGPSRHSS
ncbi:hypothetical protein WJX72_003676 [[Myrmecia] bisecta]|uniref:Uncharacterized protein n=1 Tax=[Myrmecia] bisecta TaxID=41462 RepID=A0AAW1Q2C6_9CHLO